VRRGCGQQSGEIGDCAGGGADGGEIRRAGRLGGGVADGEDRMAAVGRQGRIGGDAIGAGEGQGGDAVQVGRGLRNGPNGQKRENDRREAEGGQPVGGARSAGLGAGDPDAADRRQGSTR